jgi:zinc protease
MMKNKFGFACCLLLLASFAYGQESPILDIAFKRFVLDNGLRVIIAEDHKAPIVAVHTRYHVGSKNEPDGRRGFAHLFEHLLFQGSENLDQEFFDTQKLLGLTSINGTTSYDRTNYFQTVPKQNLDALLWVESDRMGHVLGSLTQDKLENQVSVVLNELGETQNQPYRGVLFDYFPQATYPLGHPYSWPVIGAEEDLRAATLQDAKQWFRDYYGPNNAVLVIVGDVETEKVIERVRHYYGAIKPGPLKPKVKKWVAKRTGHRKDLLHDDVPFVQLIQSWNVPAYGDQAYAHLQLFADLMSEGKNAPLWKTLHLDENLVSSVFAYVDDRELGSQFNIVATLKAHAQAQQVSQRIDALLDHHIKKGFSKSRVESIRNRNKAKLLKSMEKVGGFGGKARLLAKNEIQNNGAENYQSLFQWYFASDPKQVLASAKKWLRDGKYEVVIAPDTQQPQPTVDAPREKMPTLPTDIPEASFPTINKQTLSNGLDLYHAQRQSIARLQIELIFHHGRIDDPKDKVGLNYAVFALLNEGTRKYTGPELSEAFDNLGATFTPSPGIYRSSILIEANKENIQDVLKLANHVMDHPTFPDQEWTRIQSSLSDYEEKKTSQPGGVASDLLGVQYFGADHPLAGEQWGQAKNLEQISTKDIANYWSDVVKKQLTTSIVVGDATMEEAKQITDTLTRHFEVAQNTQTPAGKRVQTTDKPQIYWYDFPGTSQTVILSAAPFPLASASKENVALDMANQIFGRANSSRINMNLREDKGWTYGVRSYAQDLRTHRIWSIRTQVQSDKTYEAFMELKKEIEYLQNPARSFTPEEIQDTRRNRLMTLTSQWETTDAVADSVHAIASKGYPLDFYQTYTQTLKSLQPDLIRAQAKEHMLMDQSMWVLVGDGDIIAPQLKKIQWAQVTQLDAQGAALKKEK